MLELTSCIIFSDILFVLKLFSPIQLQGLAYSRDFVNNRKPIQQTRVCRITVVLVAASDITPMKVTALPSSLKTTRLALSRVIVLPPQRFSPQGVSGWGNQ